MGWDKGCKKTIFLMTLIFLMEKFKNIVTMFHLAIPNRDLSLWFYVTRRDLVFLALCLHAFPEMLRYGR
jgi:hypothetical protein